MSGAYGFSTFGMQSLFDFVAPRAGLLDDICDPDFAPFIDGLVDLAARPTRFVAVELLDGSPVSVDVNGSPAGGWTWWPGSSLLELTAAPDRGDSVLVTCEPPAPCDWPLALGVHGIGLALAPRRRRWSLAFRDCRFRRWSFRSKAQAEKPVWDRLPGRCLAATRRG